VLKKLENNEMIRSYWKMQDDERPKRYYTILPEGKKQLDKNRHEWELINSFLQEHWEND
jgi:DNA-binding PadR family transcriptional regulator